MDKFWGRDFPGKPLEMFSTLHIVTLCIIAAVNIALMVWLILRKSDRLNSNFRYTLAVLLILFEVLYEAWSILAGAWSADIYLPLQLCDLTLVLSAILLINKSRFIYEVTYFLGLGGSIQALLTPDLTPYSFPHIMFFIFFFTHGAIITAVLYMTLIEGYRPVLKSIWKTFVFTNIYMAIIAVVNVLTKGNYLFICGKPPTPSLLDILGPWPWYILSLEGIGIVMYFILYAPFAVKNFFDRRRNSSPPTIYTGSSGSFSA